jgi:hypothetical protein
VSVIGISVIMAGEITSSVLFLIHFCLSYLFGLAFLAYHSDFTTVLLEVPLYSDVDHYFLSHSMEHFWLP